MMYCESYCEEKGISTSELNEAQRTLYYIAENMKMEKSISEDGYKHFQMAIKAIEQEPFINKPCVYSGVCEHDKNEVLDKIRAEIADLEEGISSYYNDRPWVFKDEVLHIIDKYKAESEGESE